MPTRELQCPEWHITFHNDGGLTLDFLVPGSKFSNVSVVLHRNQVTDLRAALSTEAALEVLTTEDAKLNRQPDGFREARVCIGDIWRDEDGVSWRVVAAKGKWVWIKRHGYPHSASSQTNRSWFDIWTLVTPALSTEADSRPTPSPEGDGQ